jgi:hypothetical protein
METWTKVYVPLISALISLVSVSIAFLTLRYGRNDRQEQRREAEVAAARQAEERREVQKAAEADSLRRQQQALLDALQGEKEAVAFMAIQLVREPHLITDSNRHRLFSALCLAFVFESSSRARALVLQALRTFSRNDGFYATIVSILDEILSDFEVYERDLGPNELNEYFPRIRGLKARLRDSTP